MKYKHLKLLSFYIFLYFISIKFYFSSEVDELPTFYEYENKEDVDFIIKNAPNKLALKRTKKLMVDGLKKKLVKSK